MIEETLRNVDFAHQPDYTPVTLIAQKVLPWLADVVASADKAFGGHENLPWAVRTIIEKQLPAKVQEMYPYERTAEAYGEYAVAFGLSVLSRGHLYLGLPTQVLEALLASEFGPMRIAAGLALLSLGAKDVQIHIEELEHSIDTGKFFQFPLDVYCRVLEGLKPLAKTTTTISRRICSHFDSASKESSFGSYSGYRAHATALFLAETGIVTEPVLEYLVDESRGGLGDATGEIFAERCRKVLVNLLETHPEARKVFADFILHEFEQDRYGKHGMIAQCIAILQPIDPRKCDIGMLRDLIRIADGIEGAPFTRDIVTVIIVLVREGPHFEEVILWLLPKLEMPVESDDDIELFGAYARGAGSLAQSDDRIAKILKRRAKKDQNESVRTIARKAYEGRYGLAH